MENVQVYTALVGLVRVVPAVLRAGGGLVTVWHAPATQRRGPSG
jgi:hypothetical protein